MNPACEGSQTRARVGRRRGFALRDGNALRPMPQVHTVSFEILRHA
jgi:hypothetical protein